MHNEFIRMLQADDWTVAQPKWAWPMLITDTAAGEGTGFVGYMDWDDLYIFP